jgi:hypothetical protein
MIDELLNKLKPEDMPNDDLRWIAADCGIDVAIRLIRTFGHGIFIYVPQFSCENWNKVKPEDLPNEDMRLVARFCGIEVAKALLQHFQVAHIYIPQLETTEWAKRFIKETYDGRNAKLLAIMLGTSDRFIYKYAADSVTGDLSKSLDENILDFGGVKAQQMRIFD